MKKHLLLAIFFPAFAISSTAQSNFNVPTNEQIKNMIITQDICDHDTAHFVWLCHHPEVRTNCSPFRNGQQTSPLVITNPGFELGFNGWTGYIGDNTVGSTSPLQNITPGIYSVGNDAPVTNAQARHTIVSNSFGNDPYGNFPGVSPGFGNYSARMGGETPNYQGEILEQTWVVNANDPYFKISYALVLNDPQTGHAANTVPYFTYQFIDSIGGTIFSKFIPANDPSLVLSALTPPTGGLAFYLPWQTDSISLAPYIGSNVTLKVTVAGCTQSGHFAYCYIDAVDPMITNTEENQISTYTVFPNPAKDIFQINRNGKYDAQEKIGIVNSLGQKINAEINATATGWKVDLSNEASGIYFIEIISGSTRSVQRLVKL